MGLVQESELDFDLLSDECHRTPAVMIWCVHAGTLDFQHLMTHLPYVWQQTCMFS